MGMFDKEEQLTKQEFAQNGTPFILRSAEYLGISKHADYGENQKARVVAGPDEENCSEYVVFGVMADQISRMESGNLPAVVAIVKDGRANTFAKVDG
jgi:hypothetical protein